MKVQIYSGVSAAFRDMASQAIQRAIEILEPKSVLARLSFTVKAKADANDYAQVNLPSSAILLGAYDPQTEAIFLYESGIRRAAGGAVWHQTWETTVHEIAHHLGLNHGTAHQSVITLYHRESVCRGCQQ